MEQLYTVEQVDALIPTLELLIERMQRRGRELRNAMEQTMGEREDAGASMSIAELLEMQPQLRPAVAEIEDCLRNIETAGGQFKGLELGLVDFAAEINGQVVLLCWQYGEKEVSFYHSLEGGFAARKPLGKQRTLLQ